MPGWYWPDDVPNGQSSEEGASFRQRTPQSPPATENPSQQHSPKEETSHTEPPRPDPSSQSGGRQRHWPPRQCRICLDTVQPTFDVPSEHLPGFMQTASNVKYEDENGRLLRPCSCKGSSKYVHESCLQDWRHADPSYGRRNYYQCPTCGFKYRLARLGAARFVGSIGKSTDHVLTGSNLLNSAISRSNRPHHSSFDRSRLYLRFCRGSNHQHVSRSLELSHPMVVTA